MGMGLQYWYDPDTDMCYYDYPGATAYNCADPRQPEVYTLGNNSYQVSEDFAEMWLENRLSYNETTDNTTLDPKQCGHNWVVYNSGWTSYEYCSICDERK